jgi:hypothetical protein
MIAGEDVEHTGAQKRRTDQDIDYIEHMTGPRYAALMTVLVHSAQEKPSADEPR